MTGLQKAVAMTGIITYIHWHDHCSSYQRLPPPAPTPNWISGLGSLV